MPFCTECGTNVPADTRFCTGCGTPMANAAAPVQPMQPIAPPQAQAAVAVQPLPPAAPSPQPAAPQPRAVVYQAAPRPQAPLARTPDAPPPKGGKYAVMGTGAYFGTMLLYSIPVVGWVACIVMAFSGGSLNRRNLARAMLIFLAVGLVAGVALYFVSSWVLEVLLEITAAQSGLYGLAG